MIRVRGAVRWFCLAAAAASGIACLLFAWMYHAFYWKHRGLFNDQERYFDPEMSVVYHEQSASLGILALGCLLLAIVLLGMARWNRPG